MSANTDNSVHTIPCAIYARFVGLVFVNMVVGAMIVARVKVLVSANMALVATFVAPVVAMVSVNMDDVAPTATTAKDLVFVHMADKNMCARIAKDLEFVCIIVAAPCVWNAVVVVSVNMEVREVNVKNVVRLLRDLCVHMDVNVLSARNVKDQEFVCMIVGSAPVENAKERVVVLMVNYGTVVDLVAYVVRVPCHQSPWLDVRGVVELVRTEKVFWRRRMKMMMTVT
jgi:hypothetical protein